MRLRLLLSLFALITGLTCFGQTVRYVRESGIGDGSSWANASGNLQAMINASTPGDQVWVEGGTYKPVWTADGYHAAHNTYPTTGGGRDNAFVLKDGVEVYGGFGGTESALSQRDWKVHETVLSGDLGEEVLAFHVVIAVGVSGAGLLDGFTITKGRAWSYFSGTLSTVNGTEVRPVHGGGVFCEDAATSFANLTITGNSAELGGGGVYNSGGAPSFTNVAITANTSGISGGGVYNIASSPVFTNVAIAGNEAEDSGGGVDNSYGSAPVFVNVAITGNKAGYGGGVYNYDEASPVFTNATIAGNLSTNEYSAGGIHSQWSIHQLRNTIVYGNSGHESQEGDYAYSLVEGVTEADAHANLPGSRDPLFIDPLRPSSAPTVGGNYATQQGACSPVINAGNNAYVTDDYDLSGDDRIQWGRIDLGAYESASYAAYAVPDAQGVVYAKPGGTGTGRGGDWDNAMDLADAFLAANCDNSPITQIWAAEGTYTPAYPPFNATVSVRDKTFLINRDGLKVYGGFAGWETSLSQRNWGGHETILSGDLGPDGRAFHVVLAAAVAETPLTPATTLDGFTITGGEANSNLQTWITLNGVRIYRDRGGAMSNAHASMSMTNLVVKGNMARESGGGIYNHGSSPRLSNVLISGNRAGITAGSGLGGGISNDDGSPVLTNVTVAGNSAFAGGAVFNMSGASSPVFQNTLVWNNSSGVNGGTPAYFHSLVQGATTPDESGNISGSTNPGFEDARAPGEAPTIEGDYRLSGGSPAVDAGNGLYLLPTPSGEPAGGYDLARTPRIQQAQVDIGAYEYQCAPLPMAESQTVQPGDLLSTLTGTGENLKWYGSATDTVPLPADTPLTEGVYYLSQTLDHCESGRIPVTVYLFSPVRYVTTIGAGTGSGYSWENASTDLQAMIDGAGTEEVRVGAGTYRPFRLADSLEVIAPANRKCAFVLKEGVKVLGGYPAVGGAERDWELNETILDGSLAASEWIHSNHVVLAVGTPEARLTHATVLDGFIIKRGGELSGHVGSGIGVNGQAILAHRGGGVYLHFADITMSHLVVKENESLSGAGVYVHNSSPVITYVTIHDNLAGSGIAQPGGGGMFNLNSNPILNHVTIRDNIGTIRFGGGIANHNASPVLTNVVLTGNRATMGGGVYNDESSSPVLTNVVISGNQADIGGGIYNDQNSNPTLTNVLISGNSADGSIHMGGGGMVNVFSSPVLTNVTIAGNSAWAGGGGVYNLGSSPVFRNALVWGNSSTTGPDGFDESDSHTVIFNCLVQGSSDNTNGNIPDDGTNLPVFLNAVAASAAPTSEGDYRPGANSSAIDQGSNAWYAPGQTPDLSAVSVDLAGSPRIVFGRVDIGAYEWVCTQVEAGTGTVSRVLSDEPTYFYQGCDLMAIVAPTASDPAGGVLTVNAWEGPGIIAYQNARLVARHYDLTPQEDGAAIVTLFFTQADFEYYNSAYGTAHGAVLPVDPGDHTGNLRIFQFYGASTGGGLPDSYKGTNNLIIPTSVAWDEALELWAVTFPVSGFSGFFVTGQSDEALPVTLLSFEATPSENNVLLSWQTTGEENVSHFEVERSVDGRNWELIGSKAAASLLDNGGSGQTRVYRYADFEPYQAGRYGSRLQGTGLRSVLYYRLKSRDLDGSFDYSKVLSVVLEGALAGDAWQLYPNPVETGVLRLQRKSGTGTADVRVSDLSGRYRAVPVQPTSEGLALDVRHLPSGIYLVHVRDGSGRQLSKLVVVK